MGQKAIFPPEEFTFSDSNRLPDFIVRSLGGSEIRLSDYKGKKIIFVNVASECGFTPQYKELENLYKENKELVKIIGIPSNQFGEQEPESNEDINDFCETNYGITFPIIEKTSVKGENKCELYQWLTNPKKNGWNSKEPAWNFCKYLIDEKGFLVAYYPSHVVPSLSS
jgi:glutathione peroxidase